MLHAYMLHKQAVSHLLCSSYRSRSAQVRAGLWRRNGPGMTDQVLNYCGKLLPISIVVLHQISLS